MKLSLKIQQILKEAEETSSPDVYALVNDNMKLAYWLGHRYGRMYHVDEEEAEQIAVSALVKAANAFDPARGAKFSSLASVYVRNDMRHAVKQIQGDYMGRVDLDAPMGDEDSGDSTSHDVIGQGDTALSRAGSGDEGDLASQAIGQLREPDQTWVRRYLAGETYREIAVDGGASFVYIGRQIQNSLAKLRKDLQSKGVRAPSQRASESLDKANQLVDTLLGV